VAAIEALRDSTNAVEGDGGVVTQTAGIMCPPGSLRSPEFFHRQLVLSTRWVNIENTGSPRRIQNLLEEAGVAELPGSAFARAARNICALARQCPESAQRKLWNASQRVSVHCRAPAVYALIAISMVVEYQVTDRGAGKMKHLIQFWRRSAA